MFSESRKKFEIVRNMVRKRNEERPGRWLASACETLLVCLILFFGMCIISSCGTSRAPVLQTRPQPVATTSPFHATTRTFDGNFTLTLTITPNHSGTNSFTMQVADRAGKPAEHIAVTLYTTMQDMLMGTDSVALRANGPGQFSATSNVLSMGGHWAIGIVIQTADHLLHKAGVRFVLPS